jgi:hypothetical protein
MVNAITSKFKINMFFTIVFIANSTTLLIICQAVVVTRGCGYIEGVVAPVIPIFGSDRIWTFTR